MQRHNEIVKWLRRSTWQYLRQSVTKMTNKVKHLLLTIVILLCIQRLTAKDIVEETSMLDSGFMRSLFHSFRDFTFRLIGSTSRKTRGNFLQEPNDNFPCDLRGMRSKKVPTSVHRLKPGICRRAVENFVRLKNVQPFRRYWRYCCHWWFFNGCVRSYIN